MSSDWIPISKDTPYKTEILQVAQITGISRLEAFAYFFLLYSWADSNIASEEPDGNAGCNADGNAPGVTLAILNSVIGAPSGVTEAFEEVGWLESTPKGVLFKNFFRYHGKSSKTRELTRRRVQRFREKKRKSNANSVTDVTQTALPKKRTERYQSVTTEQNNLNTLSHSGNSDITNNLGVSGASSANKPKKTKRPNPAGEGGERGELESALRRIGLSSDDTIRRVCNLPTPPTVQEINHGWAVIREEDPTNSPGLLAYRLERPELRSKLASSLTQTQKRELRNKAIDREAEERRREREEAQEKQRRNIDAFKRIWATIPPDKRDLILQMARHRLENGLVVDNEQRKDRAAWKWEEPIGDPENWSFFVRRTVALVWNDWIQPEPEPAPKPAQKRRDGGTLIIG